MEEHTKVNWSIKTNERLPGLGGRMGRIGASFSNNVALPVVAATMSSRDELISALNFMECGSVDALPTPVLLRLANIGDTCSIETTKFDGNTPIFAPSFPFHQPSSTCDVR